MTSQHYASDTPIVITPRLWALGLYLCAAYVGFAMAAAGIVEMFTRETSIEQAAWLVAAGVVLALLTKWRARNLLNGMDAALTTDVSAADAERALLPRAAF